LVRPYSVDELEDIGLDIDETWFVGKEEKYSIAIASESAAA
jgi:hypothetical protein